MPFWFFKDNVNRQHEHPELGIIRSANLCMEVMQPTDENHTAVCNLSSVNIARLDEYDLKEVLELTLRFLDNSIDLTVYPSERSERTQKERRSTGIGFIGEAEYIANKKIMYGCDEHKEWIEEFYSKAKKYVDEANRKLAEEKGSCPAVKGVRSAYTMAIAPNSNSGLVGCTTNNVEPVYNKVWVEKNLLGTFKVTAPNINTENFYYYVNPYEIDQMKLVECTAIRQKYIDMGISHNLYFDPSKITGKVIRDTIRHAWKNGLKTLYYLRSKPPRNNEIKEDKVACVGCAN
jgi:ribonucleoside-diphosphate reductase alpha chain